MKLKGLLISFLLLCPLTASADRIVLKSGRQIDGLITKVTDSRINVESYNGSEWIFLNQIRTLGGSPEENARNSQLIEKAKLGIAKLDVVELNIVDHDTTSIVAKSEVKKVDLYMTSWCGYCRQMISFFKQKGILYSAHDIEKDPAANKAYRKYGGFGVPVVVVGETVIYGYDPDAVSAALKQ